ncbi:MAG: HEPN domain-containing protein [Methylococcales bacterium]|jgi:HEPN domain-containing protein|nr:HEPN domain-containing protein [Methylococcales bacterium]
MKTAQEIKDIALERLQEAAILCDNGKYDGAFYLAGYSVELMLKAKFVNVLMLIICLMKLAKILARLEMPLRYMIFHHCLYLVA